MVLGFCSKRDVKLPGSQSVLTAGEFCVFYFFLAFFICFWAAAWASAFRC